MSLSPSNHEDEEAEETYSFQPSIPPGDLWRILTRNEAAILAIRCSCAPPFPLPLRPRSNSAVVNTLASLAYSLSRSVRSALS